MITVKPVEEQVEEMENMEEEEVKEEAEEIIELKEDVDAEVDEGADCGMDEPTSIGTMGYSLCGR